MPDNGGSITPWVGSGRLGMKKYLALGALSALVTFLLVWVVTAQAATTDTAAAAGPASVRVGEPATFDSLNPCTSSCRLRWVWRDGSRLGRQMGEGPRVVFAFDRVGSALVQLDLSQPCAGGGGRIVCHSYAYVYVKVTA